MGTGTRAAKVQWMLLLNLHHSCRGPVLRPSFFTEASSACSLFWSLRIITAYSAPCIFNNGWCLPSGCLLVRWAHYSGILSLNPHGKPKSLNDVKSKWGNWDLSDCRARTSKQKVILYLQFTSFNFSDFLFFKKMFPEEIFLKWCLKNTLNPP